MAAPREMELHEVLLAEPRGFCAGVDRAIEIVERALKKFGAPIYVRHEIVHNTYVVNDLKAKGATPEACITAPWVALAQANPCPDFSRATPAKLKYPCC